MEAIVTIIVLFATVITAILRLLSPFSGSLPDHYWIPNCQAHRFLPHLDRQNLKPG